MTFLLPSGIKGLSIKLVFFQKPHKTFKTNSISSLYLVRAFILEHFASITFFILRTWSLLFRNSEVKVCFHCKPMMIQVKMNKGYSFTIICSSSILRYYAYNNSRYYETAHLSNFGINFHVTLNVKILDVFIFVRHKIENSISRKCT